MDDAEQRKALYDRFVLSQKIVQKDPWAERATQGVESHEFTTLNSIA